MLFWFLVGPPRSIFRPWKVAFLFFRQRKIFWEHFGRTQWDLFFGTLTFHLYIFLEDLGGKNHLKVGTGKATHIRDRRITPNCLFDIAGRPGRFSSCIVSSTNNWLVG